jgi:hypothetical protein
MTSSLKMKVDSTVTGFKVFTIGNFRFERCEYFAYIHWPTGSHMMPVDAFLRALMRDIAWGFFYGTVNFDNVVGTTNHYGTVDLFAGTLNAEYKASGKDFLETFPSDVLMKLFVDMQNDWTNAGFDPFAAPQETGEAWGRKNGSNREAIARKRQTAKRMIGVPGDTEVRTDDNGYKVNRAFLDVDQGSPEIVEEPGFHNRIHAFNLFGFLSRSDVTWNPSVVSVIRQSLLCPTTEEFVLPIEHGNDRVEWFLQVSDEIFWEIKDGQTGKLRANVVMKAGDVCCMPADIRHKGLSPKRSMLIVWENGSPEIMQMVKNGTVPRVGVEF